MLLFIKFDYLLRFNGYIRSAPPSAAGKKRKPRLSDVEDKTSHFQSQKGKQYEQAINKRRIQAELQTLAGLAIWVEPESGILQAYEEINVKVLCYADMCGSYSDVLLFQVLLYVLYNSKIVRY